MNFAVTGGAGFIGSHLTKYLVSEGHDVTVIDNLFRGKLSNLEEVKDRINFFNYHFKSPPSLLGGDFFWYLHLGIFKCIFN